MDFPRFGGAQIDSAYFAFHNNFHWLSLGESRFSPANNLFFLLLSLNLPGSPRQRNICNILKLPWKKILSLKIWMFKYIKIWFHNFWRWAVHLAWNCSIQLAGVAGYARWSFIKQMIFWPFNVTACPLAKIYVWRQIIDHNTSEVCRPNWYD